MSKRSDKSRLLSIAAPKHRKNGSRVYIDPSDFYLMRRRAFLTTEKAAKLLDVTHRTLLNWEKGKSRIPYTAYRVLKIKVGYVFDDEHFNDWFVKEDTLWSPEGRGFKPHELRYISHYFWMARHWLAERQLLKPPIDAPAKLPRDSATFSRLHGLDSTIASEAASGVSPAPSGKLQPDKAGALTPCGATPLRELAVKNVTLQLTEQRPKDFERFLETLGIVA